MVARLLMGLVLAFCAGWIASLALGTAQQPLVAQAVKTGLHFPDPADVPSPSDTIPDESVRVLPNRVEIEVTGAVAATFTDTNSMDPVIDIGMTALELPVTKIDQVSVGDIVSYKNYLSELPVIHRVVEKGIDREGAYLIMKGDNAPTTDPLKVMESQLRRKIVGIIY